MIDLRGVSIASALLLAAFAAGCGSNEPSGTTPSCVEPDAADCFTLPDGGNPPTPQPDAAPDVDNDAAQDAAAE